MNKYKIGFIGYGKMARAIARYLGESGYTDILASDPVFDCPTGKGVQLFNDNKRLVSSCDIIFLSVKPQTAADALKNIDFTDKIVISIMAGLTLDKLSGICFNAAKIVRVMPNLCAQVGKSVNAYTVIGLSQTEKEDIEALLNTFGAAYNIDEKFFDTVTGITGSAPAYVFRFIKNIIECGCDDGLSFEQSKNMVLDMTAGCAQFLAGADSLCQIQTMTDNVCSKGGTTIEGIKVLDGADFDDTVKCAVKSAIKRSKELGK